MNGIEVTVNINLNGEKVAGITTGEQAAETLPPGDAGHEVTQKGKEHFDETVEFILSDYVVSDTSPAYTGNRGTAWLCIR